MQLLVMYLVGVSVLLMLVSRQGRQFIHTEEQVSVMLHVLVFTHSISSLSADKYSCSLAIDRSLIRNNTQTVVYLFVSLFIYLFILLYFHTITYQGLKRWT